MIGRISRRSRTWSTGVESSRIAVLLLADHPLALLDEAHADRHGDAVRRRLVRVEDPVEELRVLLVADEQRAREDVAQEQHDAEHLVGVHAARDDPLGEVARVGLERLDAARLERVDVVVVDRRDLREDLVRRHHRSSCRVGDAPGPLLAQLRALVAQVGDQLAKQRRGVPSASAPCSTTGGSERSMASSFGWLLRRVTDSSYPEVRKLNRQSVLSRRSRAGSRPIEEHGADRGDRVLPTERRRRGKDRADKAEE